MSGAYGRDSRYRRTPTVVRVDHTGRTLPVDDTRDRPPAPGTFTHIVEGGDRLDHLGERYYDKPHKWWPIADANPGYASPLALLGLDPIAAVRLSLHGPEKDRWQVFAKLRAAVGVEDVAYEATAVPATVVITYNRASTDITTLLTTLQQAEGEPPEDAEPRVVQPIGRAGKPVVVPPEPAP